MKAHLTLGTLAFAAASTTLAGPVEETHYDILIGLADGQLTVNAISEDETTIVPGLSVFGAELGETGIPFFTDEPGLQMLDGTLGPGAALGFNILAPLAMWNGDGFDVLYPLTQPTMTLGFAGGALSATTSSGFMPGFVLAADDEGGLHEHLDFVLNGPSGLEPEAGIYLLQLDFFTNMSGIAASGPAFIIFNNGLSEREHDLAMNWVAQHLVSAPSAVFGLLHAVASSRRRRSNSWTQ